MLTRRLHGEHKDGDSRSRRVHVANLAGAPKSHGSHQTLATATRPPLVYGPRYTWKLNAREDARESECVAHAGGDDRRDDHSNDAGKAEAGSSAEDPTVQHRRQPHKLMSPRALINPLVTTYNRCRCVDYGMQSGDVNYRMR
eukprot:SAG31_NODE_301_length_18103_cov_13.772551_3_plen_142_part_00